MMWRKRKWIVVAVAAAMIVVAGGVTGGVFYAQSGTANNQVTANNQELADRVAAILNLRQRLKMLLRRQKKTGKTMP